MKKRLTLLAILASSSLFANDISVDSIGANFGISHGSYDQKNKSGVITLGNNPDKNFGSVELYATLSGVYKREDLKPYISYTYSQNDDLEHQYLLVGLNKYYSIPNTKLDLYAGALVGYGQIDWRYDPLNSSKNINSDANSFIGGLQIGANYPVGSNLSIGINAKYLIHNYETTLNPSAGVLASINHKNTSQVSLGLMYSF